jgi:hypothetical protein
VRHVLSRLSLPAKRSLDGCEAFVAHGGNEHCQVQQGQIWIDRETKRSGKGWHPLLRLYDPLEPWFDKTWKPGDFERVDASFSMRAPQ